MSTTGTRLRLSLADEIAESILARIDGEAHVVGSVRRRRPEVGDVEILVAKSATINLPIVAVILGTKIKTEPPGEYETVKGGMDGWRQWSVRHVDRGYVVDFYRFDARNRGSMMLIRTGPVEYSKAFVVGLRRNGYRHVDGYVRDGEGRIVPCPEEVTASRLAQISYLPPEERH